MISKKLAQLGFILASITSLSFGSVYAMETSKEIVKSNTVYSTLGSTNMNNDTSTLVNADMYPYSASPEASDYYRKVSVDILKNYFNISDINLENLDVTVVDAKYITSIKEYRKQFTSSITNSTDVSKQPSNSFEDFVPEEEIMNNLGHAYAEVHYISEEVVPTLYFNANTKELISINVDFEPIVNLDATAPRSVYKHGNSESDKSIDPSSFKELGINYLNEYQHLGLTNPKFVKAIHDRSNYYVYLLFEDSNNAENKVIITVNSKLNKVCGFMLKSEAKFMNGVLFEEKPFFSFIK